MKKLFVLTLIVFLAACSNSTSEPTQNLTPTNTVAPLPTTNAPDSATTQKPTASPDLGAYVDKMYLILNDLSQARTEMDQLFFLAKARGGYFTNEDWLKRANKTFDALIEGADKIDAIEPVPAQAESAHEYFQMAAEELRLVVASQQEFIDGETSGEESAAEYMQLYLSYVQKGLDEINKFQP